jgi:hypothetical protein
MSTIDRPRPETLPPLEAGQRLDRATFHARYEAMPPDTRAELIEGIVYMPSPISRDHMGRQQTVLYWLGHYRRFTPGVWGGGSASVFLDERNEVQPDALLLIPPEYGGRTRDQGGYLANAPELIVEIARSSRAVDLGPKFRVYERAGALEYLVVALDPDEVRWFTRREDRLAPIAPGNDGLILSEVFPGLWLDPVALFKNDLNRLIAVLEEGLASPEHAAFVALLAERRGGT